MKQQTEFIRTPEEIDIRLETEDEESPLYIREITQGQINSLHDLERRIEAEKKKNPTLIRLEEEFNQTSDEYYVFNTLARRIDKFAQEHIPTLIFKIEYHETNTCESGNEKFQGITLLNYYNLDDTPTDFYSVTHETTCYCKNYLTRWFHFFKPKKSDTIKLVISDIKDKAKKREPYYFMSNCLNYQFYRDNIQPLFDLQPIHNGHSRKESMSLVKKLTND